MFAVTACTLSDDTATSLGEPESAITLVTRRVAASNTTRFLVTRCETTILVASGVNATPLGASPSAPATFATNEPLNVPHAAADGEPANGIESTTRAPTIRRANAPSNTTLA